MPGRAWQLAHEGSCKPIASILDAVSRLDEINTVVRTCRDRLEPRRVLCAEPFAYSEVVAPHVLDLTVGRQTVAGVEELKRERQEAAERLEELGGPPRSGVGGSDIESNPRRPRGVIRSMWARALGPLTVVILVLGLASFGAGAATPARGVVSGKAVPCSGPMYVPTAHVSVFRGRALVTSGRFRTGTTFRFSLPAGRYLITNNRAYPTVGTPFRIRGGGLTRVVMKDDCD